MANLLKQRCGSVASKVVLVIALVAVGAGIGWATWSAQAQNENSQSQTAQQVANAKSRTTSAEIGVGALGRLEPGRKVFQIAPSVSAEGARIESLLVEEGSEVEAGAILAIVDTHSTRLAALAEAQAQVKVLRAKLALTKAGAEADEVKAQEAAVAHLRVSYQNAMANYDRAATLKASRSISSEEYDSKRFQAEMAKHLIAQAESTLSALQTVRPEDIALAEAELAKAEAGVACAEADLEATNVRSPIAGRVLKIHSRQGERVSDRGIAEIGDTSDMQAVAEVYERDVPRVQVGQQATVRVQSLPGELTGEVVQVGWQVGRRVVLDNDPVKDTDARVVEVRVKLDPASAERVARLSYARVEVRIDTAEVR